MALRVPGPVGKAAASCRTPKLVFSGAVEDDADFFEGDEAAVDPFVEARENFFDALGRFDDFEDDGKILRQAQKFIRVIDAGAAVAADATNDGGTGEAFFTEHLDDGVVESFAVPFVGFADMDAHQGALTFEFLVGHGFSSLSPREMHRAKTARRRRVPRFARNDGAVRRSIFKYDWRGGCRRRSEAGRRTRSLPRRPRRGTTSLLRAFWPFPSRSWRRLYSRQRNPRQWPRANQARLPCDSG